MRSNWSTERALLWLATATVEAGWLTLVNVSLQWLKQTGRVDLGIVAYSVAVLLGMILAHWFQGLPQTRFAAVLTAGAVGTAVVGALISGAPTSDVGAFVRYAVLDPGVWLLGLGVLRGVMQGEPGSGYETERVFALGIPGLVVFWLLATSSLMLDDPGFASVAFTASLTFVCAGLLALGLGRLDDLDVDAVDRGARRRWLTIVIGIVAVVAIIGVPLAALLGLPISSVIVGVLGPIAPLLFGLFSLLSIPIFWFLDALVGFINPGGVGLPSIPPQPTPVGSGPPPIFEQPTGPPPDLTWLLIALVLVGAFVLLRIVAAFLSKPTPRDAGEDAPEVRVNEKIELPSLPSLPRLHLPGRRPVAHTASQAYVLSLAALDGRPEGRRVDETPREHARRIVGTAFGRDLAWLATDYQLAEFVEQPLTAKEVRRALARWRRVVSTAGRRRRTE